MVSVLIGSLGANWMLVPIAFFIGRATVRGLRQTDLIAYAWQPATRFQHTNFAHDDGPKIMNGPPFNQSCGLGRRTDIHINVDLMREGIRV